MRLTIRDLLWLAVVVAIAIGWMWDHRRVERRLESVEAAIRFMDAGHRRTEGVVDYLLRQSGHSPKPSEPRAAVLPE